MEFDGLFGFFLPLDCHVLPPGPGAEGNGCFLNLSLEATGSAQLPGCS